MVGISLALIGMSFKFQPIKDPIVNKANIVSECLIGFTCLTLFADCTKNPNNENYEQVCNEDGYP